MPGFTTHYLFGLNTYRQLDNSLLKKIIQKNHAAYSLGLQGPDIFFYFLPSYTIHANNIGSVAHTKHTGEFLRHLLESRNLFSEQTEKNIADAYIAGFLGHYTLDTHCHPYIYWKTHFKQKSNRYHGRHMSLEVDIDTKLLAYYRHCRPSSFQQNSTIRLTRRQFRTIAGILHYVYQKTYPELGILKTTMRISIRSMQIGTRWLWDPSGRKKTYLSKLEKFLLGYPLLSTLIPSDTLTVHTDPLNLLHMPWQNPWDRFEISIASFPDLMERAQIRYLDLLTDLNQLFHRNPQTPAAKIQKNKLLEKLGNQSYHSGLDSKLPS